VSEQNQGAQGTLKEHIALSQGNPTTELWDTPATSAHTEALTTWHKVNVPPP